MKVIPGTGIIVQRITKTYTGKFFTTLPIGRQARVMIPKREYWILNEEKNSG